MSLPASAVTAPPLPPPAHYGLLDTSALRMYSVADNYILPLSPASEYSSESVSSYPTYSNINGLMPADSSPSPPPAHFQPHFYSDHTSTSYSYLPSAPSSSLARYAYTDSKYYSQLPSASVVNPFNSGATSSHPTTPGLSFPSGPQASYPAPNTHDNSNHLASSSSGGGGAAGVVAYPPSSSSAHASLQSVPATAPPSRSVPARSSSYYPGDAYTPAATDAVHDSYFPAHGETPSHSYQQQDYPPSSRSYGAVPATTEGASGYGEVHQQHDTAAPVSLPNVREMLRARSPGVGPTRTNYARRVVDPYPTRDRRGSAVKSDPYSPPLSQLHSSLPSVEVPSSPEQPSSPQRSTRAKKPKLPVPSADKAFTCHICQASFARNHDLTRHYTGHEKVKAFKCDGCDRAFTRKDALKRHSQTKNCGHAQDGEPSGWLRRKTASSKRNDDGSEREEHEVLLMEPGTSNHHRQRVAAPVMVPSSASSPSSSTRGPTSSRGAGGSGTFYSTRSRDAPEFYHGAPPMGIHGSREISPVSELMGLAQRSPSSRVAVQSPLRQSSSSLPSGSRSGGRNRHAVATTVQAIVPSQSPMAHQQQYHAPHRGSDMYTRPDSSSYGGAQSRFLNTAAHAPGPSAEAPGPTNHYDQQATDNALAGWNGTNSNQHHHHYQAPHQGR